MNTALRKKVGGLALAGLVFVIAGCDRPPPDTAERGPAERTGEQVDQALTKAGDQLNKVAEKAGQNLQEFGQRLQAEAREAQEQRNQSSGASGTESRGPGEAQREGPAAEQGTAPTGQSGSADSSTPSRTQAPL